MTSDEIYELTELMKRYHPYNDSLDKDLDCYCDSDYRRGYEAGYSRGWTTVMFGLKTELRDEKYVVKQRRRSKK